MRIRHKDLVGKPSPGFSESEKAAMLNLSGVGPTVIQRLEEIGYTKLSQLGDKTAADITREIASRFTSTCWKNSPQAKKAIQAVIDLANA